MCVISSILLPVQRSLELCYPCGTGSTSELAECNCPQKSFAVSSIMLGATASFTYAIDIVDELQEAVA